jgi:hypothetical protein
MTTLIETPVNATKVGQLEAILAQILAESLRRGFHGKATLEWAVQDGTIQNIRRVVERVEK